MPDWIAQIVASIIGGILALMGAIWAVRKTSRDLELDQIRKNRVECLSNLMGLRHTISRTTLSAQDMSRRSFELNRIQALWSDDPAVLHAVRQFHIAPTNDHIIALIRAMGKTSRLPIENLTDADITNMFQ